jgi:hypothetical protein
LIHGKRIYARYCMVWSQYMLKQCKHWLLFAVCITWSLGGALAGTPVPKPQSPVAVHIQVERPPVAGEVATFMVTASTALEADEFSIRIQLPPTMSLTGGQLFWSGPLARGGTKTLRFSATYPASGVHQVSAVARIQKPDRARYAARAVYRIGQPGTAAKSLKKESDTKRTTRHGRPVVEYPLK